MKEEEETVFVLTRREFQILFIEEREFQAMGSPGNAVFLGLGLRELFQTGCT